MTLLLQHGGVQKQPLAGWAKIGGVWQPILRGSLKAGAVWGKEYQYERRVTIAANAAQISAQSYFDPADWANPAIDKILIVGAGVNVWSYTPGTPALNVGTGRGGKLTIENNGYILGAGGNANSGLGGDALFVGQSGVTIINNGAIYGGGGGGGVGGQGGPGYYQTPYTLREPSSGTYYDGYSYTFDVRGQQIERISFGGYQNVSGPSGNVTMSGGYFYADRGGYRYWGVNYRGSNDSGSVGYYDIYRTSTQYNTYYTSGGAGGAGGRGTGYNASLANVYQNGSGGAGGGTNAGTGGAGGNGGGWGASGASGNTGAGGNNGGGSGGAAGGLAGRYINGNDNIASLINNGTLLGRVA
ncbi:hypothetical protein PSC71_13235 [Devosia sp. J2-20]|uniref:hypothetical protein n=1 Tax=Devosia sp. J2-20 TaxID=3026161 RepID=UPI00249AE1FF|nr:hypothetical protein [Devosia sp. J2-20]WDQ98192.1 hypothetical protein PSC71_13235 [Devosia sp. J2-20]